MTLVTDSLEVVLHSNLIKHFENLGYTIPKEKDKCGKYRVPKGTMIKVDVKDLPKGSSAIMVKVRCDYCFETTSRPYRDYVNSTKNSIINKDCCKTCKILKCREVTKVIYDKEDLKVMHEKRGAKRRKSHEKFTREVYELVGNEYVITGEYTKSDEVISILHVECGKKFLMSPRKFLIGQRCLHCKGKRISESKTKLNSEFVEEFNLARGKEYELKSVYSGSKQYVSVLHKQCGSTFPVTPSNFINKKSGCPICYGHKDTLTFKRQIEEIHKHEIEVLEEYKNNRSNILVKHTTCGHVWYKKPKCLLRGGSCPKCNMSKGERLIGNWLYSKNIKNEPQKKYDELLGVGGGQLSYDFYIPEKNLLIEYQGEFHDGTARIQNKNEFLVQKEHDKRKSDFAIKNNIDLLEIWYWDLNKIEDVLEKYIEQTEYIS